MTPRSGAGSTCLVPETAHAAAAADHAPVNELEHPGFARTEADALDLKQLQSVRCALIVPACPFRKEIRRESRGGGVGCTRLLSVFCRPMMAPGLQAENAHSVGRVPSRGARADIGADAGSGDPAYKLRMPIL